MARKPTGRLNGRPPRDSEAAAVAAEADRTGAPVGEVAKRRGVGRSTVFALKAKHRAGKGAPAKPDGTGPALAAPPPPTPPVGSQAPSLALGPIDRLRAYAGHDREALAALEALLVPPEEGLGRDELADLREGLKMAAGVVRDAAAARKGGAEGDDGPLLRALQRLEGLGKTVATVKAKRPPEDGPDEATRRILAVRERAVERIGVLTGEEAAAFAVRRADLERWAGENLGPVLGVEVVRRVGEMLGGPAA